MGLFGGVHGIMSIYLDQPSSIGMICGLTQYIFGGFPENGGTPIAGWFVSWSIMEHRRIDDLDLF